MPVDLTPEALVKRRVQQCQDELQALLKKYNCALDCSITIGQDTIAPAVFVVALKDPIKADEKIPMPPVDA